ncbi:YacP-like NYN domain protein [Leptospira interrogans serovar Canicola]|nr:YacP-like NYN domain protein [Leptospira interrogans serovar Canicola]
MPDVKFVDPDRKTFGISHFTYNLSRKDGLQYLREWDFGHYNSMLFQVAIDGFNLIYKFPDLEESMYQNRLSDARRTLLEWIELYSKKKEKTKLSHFF